MLYRDGSPQEKHRGMDAKSFGSAWPFVFMWFALVFPQSAMGQHYLAETQHFRVFANDPNLAREVGQMAEQYRRHLALHWLEKEMPSWMEKVPVIVNCSPRMLASGETKYTLVGGRVRQIQMVLSGTRERILDSVLPHEMTHTVLATHFAELGKPVPRWADEGACTTVEHASERSKHDTMLVRYLSEGRGIAFKGLFVMRDYPEDMMPLYAQGYSLCSFLIAQGGPRQFVRFLERGMQDEDWRAAIEQHYGYPLLGKLQSAWNDWVRDGGGTVRNYTAVALGYVPGSSSADTRLASVRQPGALQPGAMASTPLASGTASLASANVVPDRAVALAVAELPAPAIRTSQNASNDSRIDVEDRNTRSAMVALNAGPQDPFLSQQVRPSVAPDQPMAITRTSGYYQQQFQLHSQTRIIDPTKSVSNQENPPTTERTRTLSDRLTQSPSQSSNTPWSPSHAAASTMLESVDPAAATSGPTGPPVTIQSAQPAPFQTVGGTLYR
jgi:hypothetical protein